MNVDCLPHLHVAAIHAEPGYRSVTPGIGVLCRERDFMVGAGVFSNSIGRPSKYALVGWQPLRIGPVRIGAVAGAIDGYKFREGKAFPFAAGAVSMPLGALEAHLTLIPKLEKISPATVGRSWTRPLYYF